eukprot:m.56517 g.56517  ORF g.56517 m.56517 type:complete len:149 (-) comp18757_c0_seq1:558-1004(-)
MSQKPVLIVHTSLEHCPALPLLETLYTLRFSNSVIRWSMVLPSASLAFLVLQQPKQNLMFRQASNDLHPQFQETMAKLFQRHQYVHIVYLSDLNEVCQKICQAIQIRYLTKPFALEVTSSAENATYFIQRMGAVCKRENLERVRNGEC